MKKTAALNRNGRPPRGEKTDKLNLLVSVKAKRRAFALASDGDFSVGRLFEKLLDKRWTRWAATHPKEAAAIEKGLPA